MRAAISVKIFMIIFCLTVISGIVMAQGDMKKPDPVNNATINMILGIWEAEPYEIMGSKRTETSTYRMAINGQFLFIDVDGKDETGYTYKSVIVMKVNNDGTFTGWSFDDWGNVGTYTGSASGNKISATGKKQNNSDTREFEINGDTMTLKLMFTMKWDDGTEKTVNQNVTYHKK